jgi:hypothetical protein
MELIFRETKTPLNILHAAAFRNPCFCLYNFLDSNPNNGYEAIFVIFGSIPYIVRSGI